MAVLRKFIEMQAWQKARQATMLIYRATASESFGNNFYLRDQIRRTSESIMANIVDGRSKPSDDEFASCLRLAHNSVVEAQSHLYLAANFAYLSKEEFKKIHDLLDEISKITAQTDLRLGKSV